LDIKFFQHLFYFFCYIVYEYYNIHLFKFPKFYLFIVNNIYHFNLFISRRICIINFFYIINIINWIFYFCKLLIFIIILNNLCMVDFWNLLSIIFDYIKELELLVLLITPSILMNSLIFISYIIFLFLLKILLIL